MHAAILAAVAAEPSIDAAYLFGSAARDAAGPLSDVDVALLVGRSPAGDPAIVERVAERLELALGPTRLDLVHLNTAPLPLRYRDGRRVVVRNAAHLERFIVESTLQYLDFAPLRERVFQLQRAAILDGR